MDSADWLDTDALKKVLSRLHALVTRGTAPEMCIRDSLYTKTMESSITLWAMADNGTLAVVTEDPGSAARLRVYSSSMEQLLSWSLTIADGTPLRLAFSPDGRRLAVGHLNNLLKFLVSSKIFYL